MAMLPGSCFSVPLKWLELVCKQSMVCKSGPSSCQEQQVPRSFSKATRIECLIEANQDELFAWCRILQKGCLMLLIIWVEQQQQCLKSSASQMGQEKSPLVLQRFSSHCFWVWKWQKSNSSRSMLHNPSPQREFFSLKLSAWCNDEILFFVQNQPFWFVD